MLTQLNSPHPSPLPVRRGEGEGTSHSLSFLNSTAVHLGHLPSKGRGRCQVRLSHIVRIRRCPCWRRNSGPEARLTGRPEVCPTFRREQLPQVNTDSPGQGPRRAREVDEGTDREMSRMQSRGIGKMRLYGPGSPL